jgi:hypothetical protein
MAAWKGKGRLPAGALPSAKALVRVRVAGCHVANKRPS